MPNYTPQVWSDNDVSKPLSAARMNYIEAGIAAASYVITRRTSDSAAKNNNTLANDDTLWVTVGANQLWWFDALLIFNGANATMDIKVGWTVPSGTIMRWGGPGMPAGAGASMAGVGTGTAPQFGTESTALSTGSGAAVDVGLWVSGWIQSSSTTGNVVLQWAQVTTDAGNLIIRTLSMIRAMQIA